MQDDFELVNTLMGGTEAMRAAGTKYLTREQKKLWKHNQDFGLSLVSGKNEDTLLKSRMAGEIEKWTDWPRRSGKKLIGLVLDELLDLYDDIHQRKGRIPGD